MVPYNARNLSTLSCFPHLYLPQTPQTKTRSQSADMEQDAIISLVFDIIAVLVACFGIHVTWRIARGKTITSTT
jgi:hypothetical protein